MHTYMYTYACVFVCAHILCIQNNEDKCAQEILFIIKERVPNDPDCPHDPGSALEDSRMVPRDI